MCKIIPFPKAGPCATAALRTSTSAKRRVDAAQQHADHLGIEMTAGAWTRVGDLLGRGCPPQKATEIACGLGHRWFVSELRIA